MDPLDNEEQEALYATRSANGLHWIAEKAPNADPELPAYHHDFVASTSAIDRYGDSIEQHTWRLANYRRNPVILLDHGTGPEGSLVIGRSTKVGITDDNGTKRLTNRVQFDVSELNPVGRLVESQHANGFRRAVSVGFRPEKAISRTELEKDDPRYIDPAKTPRWMAGYVYRNPELYEISSVAVPGNQEALQLGDDSDASVQRALTETTTSAVKELVLSYLREDPDVRRAILLAVFRSVPQPKPQPSSAIRWYPEK